VDDYVYEAMKAGASGFLLKTTPPRQLADAVRTVAAGDALLAPSITRRLVEQFVRRPPPGATVPPGLDELTERELSTQRSPPSSSSARRRSSRTSTASSRS
jgi:DNA-binding NarL/FixJ family response regulator